ncbi:hypothetical protein Tco_0899221 [Tanacetum coccineum]
MPPLVQSITVQPLASVKAPQPLPFEYEESECEKKGEVERSFGFGHKWCGWINGYLNSAMVSVLVNGSATSELHSCKGLKQGDLISPFLMMESLDLSFKKVLNACLYKGEWDPFNINTIVHVLKCFYMALCFKINLHKSKLMGIGTSPTKVEEATRVMGCSSFTAPFNYLEVKIGVAMSKINSWDETTFKFSSRLSK